MKQSIFEMSHIKSVTAIALLKEGKEAGKIIANWSDNRNGSVCTAQVQLNAKSGIGKAGGYGYDKLSSAVYSALGTMGLSNTIKVEPGAGNVRQAFEEAGYQVIEVI